MKLEEKGLIARFEIPDRWYSINEGLKPDALILYKNYSLWEFFYLEEKGDRLDFKVFKNEEDAYEHLWNKLLRNYNAMQISKRP
jgi:hypothetical protein